MIENWSSVVLSYHITICYFVIKDYSTTSGTSPFQAQVFSLEERNVVSNWDTTADIEIINLQTQHEANTRDIK